MHFTVRLLALACFATTTVACSDDDLDEEETVAAIFDAFQPTMAKIVAKGYEAKNASTSGANITTPVTGAGDLQGTMTIGGKTAQSSGSNQNFTLWVQLDGPYIDVEDISFVTDNTTDETKLQFPLQITIQPADNRMAGTLKVALDVDGDIEGTAIFAFTIATDLADDDVNPAPICSRITGTITQEDTHDFDFILPRDTSTLDAAQLTKCQGL